MLREWADKEQGGLEEFIEVHSEGEEAESGHAPGNNSTDIDEDEIVGSKNTTTNKETDLASNEIPEEPIKINTSSEIEERKEYWNLKRRWSSNVSLIKAITDKYNEVEKVDISVKLLSDLSKFNPQRLGLTVDAQQAHIFLKKGLSKLSAFKLRMNACSILDILLGADDSELLLEWFIQHLIESPTQQALLEQAGLTIDNLISREQNALSISKRLALEFVAKRRAGEKFRAISIKHAIEVIKEANLSSERHGDATILSRVIW